MFLSQKRFRVCTITQSHILVLTSERTLNPEWSTLNYKLADHTSHLKLMKSNRFSVDLGSRENRGLCPLSEEVLIRELNHTLC